MRGVGCRVQGEGCRVQGLGCRVQGVGCRVGVVGCEVKMFLRDASRVLLASFSVTRVLCGRRP